MLGLSARRLAAGPAPRSGRPSPWPSHAPPPVSRREVGSFAVRVADDRPGPLALEVGVLAGRCVRLTAPAPARLRSGGALTIAAPPRGVAPALRAVDGAGNRSLPVRIGGVAPARA